MGMKGKQPTPSTRGRAPARVKRKQPESLRLRQVMPSLTVQDIERSIAFYRGVLGFHVKDRWEDGGRLVGAEVIAGAVTIGLSQDDFAKGRDRIKGIGHRLWCMTAQDIDGYAARIRERGGQLDEGPTDAFGVRMITITDPDGFKLSFTHEA